MSDHDHNDDQAICDVADEITLWQHAAQHLPLTEVNDMAASSLQSLGQILNTFNTAYKAYLDEDQHDDALVYAEVEVARQATAAAIFILGLSQRVNLTLSAHSN